MSIDAFHPLRFFVFQFTYWQVIFKKKKKGLKGENWFSNLLLQIFLNTQKRAIRTVEFNKKNTSKI